MRRNDQLENLLAARDQTARLPRSRFVGMRWSDIRSNSALLVSTPHAYRWMTVDPGVGNGWPRPGVVQVSLDAPITGAQETFNLHCGSWAPIAGRTVFVRALSDHGVFPASLSDSIASWLTEEPAPPPLQIGGLTKTSIDDVVPIAAADPTTGTQGSRLYEGYNYITIQIHDNVSGTRIQGAEADDIEVWWWDERNSLWCHNTNDDFSATGRGQASAAHDFEVYHVPHNFQRVALVNRTGGFVLWANILFSRDNR